MVDSCPRLRFVGVGGVCCAPEKMVANCSGTCSWPGIRWRLAKRVVAAEAAAMFGLLKAGDSKWSCLAVSIGTGADAAACCMKDSDAGDCNFCSWAIGLQAGGKKSLMERNLDRVMVAS